MTRTEIIIKLSDANKTLAKLKRDNDYDQTTGDWRFDWLLNEYRECIEALIPTTPSSASPDEPADSGRSTTQPQTRK